MNKSKLICLFAILMLVTIVETSPHLAFADSATVIIRCGASITDRSCTTTDSFNPQVVNINVGDTVTWTNADTVGHTVTSGSSSDSVTGTVFDSSLILAGGSFSFTFSQAGTYNYFDMVYPSITGQVIVSPSTQTYVQPQSTPQQSSIPQTTESSQSQTTTIPSTTAPTVPSTAMAPIQYSIPYWVKNDAKWWSEGQISDGEFVKAIQYLVDNGILTPNQAMSEINQLQSQNQAIRQSASQTTNQINQLQQENNNLQTENENLRLQMQQYGNSARQTANALEQLNSTLHEYLSKPYTIISNDTVNWYFSDSNGNRYYWTMPMSTYDAQVRVPTSLLVGTQYLTFPNGTRMLAQDYSPLAKTIVSSHGFRNVIDQVYNNAGSDEQFIYEVWYITAEMTTYNVDITDSNLTPFEVLTRGEGDCKDKSILIASMLRSSEHTANWKISLEEMDINNPTNPQTMNHMIVWVDTGQKTYAIEATATPDNNGLNVWAGVSIYGWQIPV
ncbi:MAG: plastocyanin/azurin family copper-binding protein [Nitrosotalea sp.]